MQRWPLVDHSVAGQLGAGARIISKQTSLGGGSPVRLLRYQQPEDHPLGRHVLSYGLIPTCKGEPASIPLLSAPYPQSPRKTLP